MTTKLYYTAPSEEAFQDLKRACMMVWNQYDDSYGYASEKIKRIESIGNIEDNFMYMLAMFDYKNQMKVASLISEETKVEINKSLIDGGNPYTL